MAVVTYRVQVKNPHTLQTLIVAKYGSIKQFCLETGMSESTVHRILKTRKISYYAASRIGSVLDMGFTELFEIIHVKGDL